MNVFISRKERVICTECGVIIPKGGRVVAEEENGKGLCLGCAGILSLAFLPSGDAAMTRRSKKHSRYCFVLQAWNQRRKRYERRGQYVEAIAIEKAEAECHADKDDRAEKNRKAAERREVDDLLYKQQFALEVRRQYPRMPKGREFAIVDHACEKHSGRVGRTAAAKEFSLEMIQKAVIAHIRHCETDYDDRFGKGKRKREIRDDIRPLIQKVLRSWV